MDCNVTYLGDLSIDGGKYGIAAPAVEYDPQFPAYLRISDINAVSYTHLTLPTILRV